jgi:AraC-like DNA-binding protein
LFCASWSELADAVDRDDRSVVVIDPLLCSDGAANAKRLKQRYASTSFIVYTELDPTPFRLVVDLIRMGFTDVVLFGYDDDRQRLERLVQHIADRVSLPAFTEALQPLLERLTSGLRCAIEDMIREPRRFRATPDLAAAAQMSTRAVFRHLKLAGFASPRRLVASARVVRAYQLLSETGRSVQEVADRLRYASADQLSQHFSELAGCTANDVKKGMPMEQFTDAILDAVIGSPAMAGTAEAGLGS